MVDTDWDPPVTASVRLVSVLGDVLQHLGQAAYVRGLAERGSAVHQRMPLIAVPGHSHGWAGEARGTLGSGKRPTRLTRTMIATHCQHRFYGDLAPWWPLISAPEEYAEEAAFAASLLARRPRTLRPAAHRARAGQRRRQQRLPPQDASSTSRLVDLSPEMVAVSRAAQPRVRAPRRGHADGPPGAEFDAVFVHDAIEYMTTEDDLRQAVPTAYAHCRPGGVAVLVPDDIVENFEPDHRLRRP